MGTLAMREWPGRSRRRRGDLFRAGTSSALDAAGALEAAGRAAADLNSPIVKPLRASKQLRLFGKLVFQKKKVPRYVGK